MSSTTENPTHILGGALPRDLALSSTDSSTFFSETEAHAETESRATTPSVSPKLQKHEPVLESLVSQNVESDPSDEMVGPETDTQSDAGSDSSATSIFHHGENTLLTMARNFRMAKQGIGLPDMEQPELAALVNHVKMMEWISKILKGARPSPPPSITGDYVKRIVATPEMRKLTWSEYHSNLGTKSALNVLTEEVPIFNASGTYQTKPTVLRARANGIPTLPTQLIIRSLPVKRIIATLTDGKLEGRGSDYLRVYRPYKLLVCFEDQIRLRLSEIKALCEEPGSPSAVDVDSDEPANTVKATRLPPDEVSRQTLTPAQRDNIIFTPKYDWNDLNAEERKEAALDLGVLVSFIDEYISPLRNAFRKADDVRLHFHELWHLFPPGSIVYVKDPGIPQKLWRVVQGAGGRFKRSAPSMPRTSHLKLGGMTGENRWHPLQLDCYYLDFDGTHFVRVIKTFQVEYFKDLASVNALPIIPLNFSAKDGFIDIGATRRRGEEFISYTKWSYSYYRGRSLIHEPEGTILCHPEKGSIGSSVVLSEAIESPVVVDFERCLREVPNWKPARVSRDLSKPSDDNEEMGRPAFPPGVDDDRMWDVQLAENVLSYTDQSRPIELHSQDPPSGDDILLLPDRVFAFILRTRKWACLPLGSGSTDSQPHSLVRMKEDHQAWDNLQIDDGHRTIIKSLMATHFRKKKSERRQFDIIQDKGKGLIILLHGVPGVGKTSTAETVAQYYNKPLLPITCGDLGMSPAEVETNLQSSFQMAQAWDCVLLLDEADVFLAERSQDNIERNALVSVFLRVMEYYEGILFLTTNKVGSFDEAFKSRMSMALYYPPLTQEQTKRIWEMQMDRTEELSEKAAPEDVSQHVKFNREEIAALSATLWNMQTTRDDCKPVWNGRQIRNAFQTAVALAEWHKKENHVSGPIIVRGDHFEKVARVSNEFNAYLYEVKHGRPDYEKAHTKEHRFDDFNRQQFVFGGQSFGQGQQGYGMSGVWQSPHQGNVIYSGQAGSVMGGNPIGGVPYGSNMQNQGAFLTNQTWQPGYGGTGNTGMGNLNMAGQSVGNSGGGNNMGAGMSPGSVNVQVLPGQSIQGQMNNPQQQQQQQQQSSSSMGQGGPMQPGFR